jgi:hypothetical protein
MRYLDKNIFVNSATLALYVFREEFSPHSINLIREILAELEHLLVKLRQ